MNPSMLSHYPSLFLSPTPDLASSAALQTSSPFIASNRSPKGLYLSRSTHWPAVQGPSFVQDFVQDFPSPTNTMPSVPVHQEAQAQAPFQAVDLSLSRMANGPTANNQPYAPPSPHSQHPPFLCNDSFGTVLKERRPPRPSNAFILFRSDLLKRKFIFKDRETRQQKLSIIAAKCWDKLTREEKKKWFLEAEREKKAYAIKYADYRTRTQSLSRDAHARSRSRDESRIMASPPRDLEQERLGRLADMAYKEIINDDPSQLKRESTISPSPCMTPPSTSGTPSPPPRVQWNEVFALDRYPSREQGHPSPQAPLAFSSPASVGEEGHLSLTTGSASDFNTLQEAHMFPTTGFVGPPHPTTIARPGPASRPMRPTAGGFSGTTAQQITTFPSELMLQGSTSINEQELY